jgi:CRISPR-associated protein (TIGR02710 family)
MMGRKILFCTVGGSHEPLLTAHQSIRPDHTYFICSKDAPHSKSSEMMITGKGSVIKASRNEEKPSLPNIPTQLGIGQDQFTVLLVEPDDIDDIVLNVNHCMKRVASEEQGAALHADYTGGTKSMTAGLVLAAMENNVALHLVRGARSNLERVCDGTQWGFPASVERVRFTRELHRHLAAWSDHAYGQAFAGIRRMEQPRTMELQQECIRAMTLSQGFDAWDRFDHQRARELLTPYRRDIAPKNPHYFMLIDLLCSDKPHSEPLKIYDLWLNALRRSAQGRFDDAVARLYRIIEWIAQWVLRKEFAISTYDIPEEFIPDDLREPQEGALRKNRDGKYQAPLYYAWELVRLKSQGPIGDTIRKSSKALLAPLQIRNSSILAHGFQPVGTKEWESMRQWFEKNLLRAFEQELSACGIKQIPKQLPQHYGNL